MVLVMCMINSFAITKIFNSTPAVVKHALILTLICAGFLALLIFLALFILLQKIVKEDNELREVNRHLTNTLEEVKELKGLIPICAWCKKIRDDKGYWTMVENYIEKYSKMTFVNSICPSCREKEAKESDRNKNIDIKNSKTYNQMKQ